MFAVLSICQVFANPLLPGGEMTRASKVARHAFQQFQPHLTKQDQLNVIVGQSIFEKIWIASPSTTRSSDGLGPLYNARACSHCHINNGRGLLLARNDQSVKPSSIIVRIGQNNGEKEAPNEGDPIYGVQIQNFAITGYQAEADVRIIYEDTPVSLINGETIVLQKPKPLISNLNYGALDGNVHFSLRFAPPLVGMGLLANISEADIQSYADPEDENSDGISGRANRSIYPETGKSQISRFNFKASSPSLEHQSLTAFKTDIGISSYLFPSDYGDCTASQVDCQSAPGGSSLNQSDAEAGRLLTDLMVSYLSNLAVPARRIEDSDAVSAGERLFLQSGCAQCHRPNYVTSAHSNIALSEQTIYPYTDLLLHDMGDQLADEVSEGLATGREWRTAPLWGIGLNKVVTGYEAYLHDGRARTLTEAILWHAGEAQLSQERFVKLTDLQRIQLIKFVESL